MSMARFSIGDRVRVRPEDTTQFAGLKATVRQVKPNGRNVAILDRYIVVFEWGEEQSFYEAQLIESHD